MWYYYGTLIYPTDTGVVLKWFLVDNGVILRRFFCLEWGRRLRWKPLAVILLVFSSTRALSPVPFNSLADSLVVIAHRRHSHQQHGHRTRGLIALYGIHFGLLPRSNCFIWGGRSIREQRRGRADNDRDAVERILLLENSTEESWLKYTLGVWFHFLFPWKQTLVVWLMFVVAVCRRSLSLERVGGGVRWLSRVEVWWIVCWF